MIESDWSKLSNPVKTILERFDINREDAILELNKEIDIPYFKGVITEEIFNEIIEFEKSKENEEYYSTLREGNKLTIHFIKSPFEGISSMFKYYKKI